MSSRAVAALAIVSAMAASAGSARADLRVTPFADGFTLPVEMVQDPLDPHTFFVVEQGGLVRVIRSGVVLQTPFLDLRSEVVSGGERGLLGLAILPRDPSHVFVCFTRAGDGASVVARFRRVAGDTARADPASRFDLRWEPGQAFVPQPFTNHNGGHLAFGPDGYLYLSFGDGGAANDPGHRAQDPSVLLGKLLRVDVDVDDRDPRGFRIPPDNPFVGPDALGARDEIWAFGLRNPWKFTFDAPALGGTGGLFIGDVGQDDWEEIDFEPAGRGGRNYGWRLREGAHQNVTSRPPAYTPLVDPIHEYGRSFGASVTAGYVYRGDALGPDFLGRFFFADFVTGRVGSFMPVYDWQTDEATATDVREHTADLGPVGNVSAFAQDDRGELYILSYSLGRIYRIEADDLDQDTLPDPWERFFGLDPASAGGFNGATGDPDGDGLDNLAELRAGTHPRAPAALTRYLAEGSTGFFGTEIAITNPGPGPARVVLRFLRPSGGEVTTARLVRAGARVTVDPAELPPLRRSDFSLIVETDALVGVDRTMGWGTSGTFGAHAEQAVASPAERWYFAEGATHSGFQLFYLVENPHPVPVPIRMTYLRPPPNAPVTRTRTLGPLERLTIHVNTESPSLAATDVSGIIESLDPSRPIVAERAMYKGAPGILFRAGHASIGATAPDTTWYFAEGATGAFFDLYLLLVNPGTTDCTAQIMFLLPDGRTRTATRTVRAMSRETVHVDRVDPALADTALSIRVDVQGGSLVAERAMWWPGGPATWWEAHASVGATASGTRWLLAAGESGGAAAAETFVLVANLANAAGRIRVTVLPEQGGPIVREFNLAAASRTNVEIARDFPELRNRRFGVLVESLGTPPAPIVVERATYASAQGVHWGRGVNAFASPAP